MPNRAAQIKEIFNEAAEREGSERAAYLDQACGNDPALREEVERLLRSLDDDDHILGRTSVGQLLFGGRESPIFSGGETLGERFRVLRMVGSGGMGEVYEAEDLRLGGRVAIKTLRSRYVNQPEFVARFRREIRLARRVTHENVCRIFDVGRDSVNGEALLYLSMEYLEGETLNERLKRGSLPLTEAHAIARQIAAGLAALHAAAVIHRDVKPANVVLTGGGASPRVVITDFGLAHNLMSDAAEESLSTTGQILGTPAYAAPEQLTAKRVGPESDVYSLGLVMYEMLCGSRPFEGDTPFESAARKLTDTIVPPSRKRPLDSRWDTLILDCLERDPEKRIRSASDVVALLDALEGCVESGHAAEVPRTASRLRRAALWGAAAAAVLVFPMELTPAGAPVRRSLCERMPGNAWFCDLPAAKDVAVFPFRTEGSTEDDRALAAGLARHVRESFHRLAPDPDKMCVHLRNDQVAEGVRLVLDGETQVAGDSVTLTLSVRESRGVGQRPPLVLRRVSHTAKVGEANVLYADALRLAAKAMGVRYAEKVWTAWTKSGPRHADSTAAYFRGLGYLTQARYEKATPEFLAATDPTRDFDFAPAQVGLAEAYRGSHSEQSARHAYERAAGLDKDYGFGGAERGLGDLELATGHAAKAVEHYTAALKFWPYDHPLQKNLVSAYESLDRVSDAEAVLRAGAQRAPHCWLPHNALGSLLSRHGRMQEAERSFLELVRLAPDNGSAYHNMAFDYIKTGRYDDAIQMASKSLEVRAYPLAYSTLARAYLYRGCASDARVNAEKAVELDRSYNILWNTLDEVLEVAAPGSTEARAATDKSIALSVEVLKKAPADALARARYAVSLARAGDRAGAIAEARRAVEQRPTDQHVLFPAAEALERAGRREEALHILEDSLRHGLGLAEIESSYGLRTLRADARYQRMLDRLRLDPSADPGQLTPRQAGGCPMWNTPGKGLKQNSL